MSNQNSSGCSLTALLLLIGIGAGIYYYIEECNRPSYNSYPSSPSSATSYSDDSFVMTENKTYAHPKVDIRIRFAMMEVTRELGHFVEIIERNGSIVTYRLSNVLGNAEYNSAMSFRLEEGVWTRAMGCGFQWPFELKRSGETLRARWTD